MLYKFFKKTMLFFSLAFTLLKSFKVRDSQCLTCCSISLEEPLNFTYTQVSLKVNVYMQMNIYPIQNYTQVPIENCLFPDKFSSLSGALSRMNLLANITVRFILGLYM